LEVQVGPGRETVVPCVRFATTVYITAVMDNALIRVATLPGGTPLHRYTTYDVSVKVEYTLNSTSRGIAAMYIIDDKGETVVQPEPDSKAVAAIENKHGILDLSQVFNTNHPYRRSLQILVAVFPDGADYTTTWTALERYPIDELPDAFFWPDELGQVENPIIADPRHNLVYGLTTGSQLVVIDPTTWTGVMRPVPGWPQRMAISPDNRYLFFGAERVNTIYSLDLETGNLNALPSRPSPLMLAPADGNRLIYISTVERMVCVMDTQTGRELWSAPINLQESWTKPQLAPRIAYVPSSRSVLMPNDKGYLARYRLEGSGELVWQEDSTHWYCTPVVEANGEYVWVWTSRFKVTELSKGPVSEMPPNTGPVIAVSPDSRYVNTGSVLYDTVTGTVVHRFGTAVLGPGFTPDSRFALYNHYDIDVYMIRRLKLP